MVCTIVSQFPFTSETPCYLFCHLEHFALHLISLWKWYFYQLLLLSLDTFSGVKHLTWLQVFLKFCISQFRKYC